MKLQKLLEMPLKEVLEKFCVLYSPECDYIYGIATNEAVTEILEKYDFSEEASMDSEPLIRLDVLFEFEENCDVLTFKRIDEIIENNLDIPLKENAK